MIDSIRIENFKCFKSTKIEGFKQFNLIGGKNNVGKSSVLEALYFGVAGRHYDLLRARGISEINTKIVESLFINNNIDLEILVDLSINKNNKQGYRYKFQNTDPFPIIPAYDVSVSGPTIRKNYKSSYSLILSKNQQFPELFDIIKAFDQAEMSGNQEIFERAIQTIDKDIEKARTFASSPFLHLKKRNEKNFTPIFNYGDALQKIMRYVVTFYNFQEKSDMKCLFIDEIENGLHYASQAEFWKMLFDLAIEFNVQIFATSHSLEMIKAYNEVALKYNFAAKAMYFEMSKTLKTERIIANAINMEQLQFEITKNQPFRGE